MPSDWERIQKVARETFHKEEFSPAEKESLLSVVAGNDTLVVTPTGSGKTTLYKIAHEMLPGPTIVVLPLRALINDQLESLQEKGLGKAVELGTDLDECRRAAECLKAGEAEFLIMSPDQLIDDTVIELLRDAKPSLIAIDEAHCASELSHDFMPAYARLRPFIEELGHPVVLATTASASPPVRLDIGMRLGMREPTYVVASLSRPELWLGVEKYSSEGEKRPAIVEQVLKADKPGIVFTQTVQAAESLANDLCERGIAAGYIHEKLDEDALERARKRLMDDEVEVLVATAAFGMGVDKKKTRFVFHYNTSDSIESYYQEVGRAGRDGEPARGVIFYSPGDLEEQSEYTSGPPLSPDTIQKVAGAIGRNVDLTELHMQTGISVSKVETALRRLDDAGVVEYKADGHAAPENSVPDPDWRELSSVQANRREFDHARREMMRGYIETRGCRRVYILTYFGEISEEPCGCCDNCGAGLPKTEKQRRLYPLGSTVRHEQWGGGIVIRYEGDTVYVLFNTVGYKRLDDAALRNLERRQEQET